ncbi:DUF1989 domain-containing protein [Sphaerotilaceae bacterium SBD11-9]
MSNHLVTLQLNTQQLDLLQRTVASGAAPDLASLARRALREQHLPATPRPQPPVPDLAGYTDTRELLWEHVMQPGTGKAVEMKAGQLLRIEQVEGGQCVDFNCFNLHDYKEFMHCGRIRTVHGLNPGPGDFLWSAPPRERAMMFLLEDTVRCNDVMFPRCSHNLYESAYGYREHTNCHDIQAEAQREYGLTPDDVHDSFNLFMCTEVRDGRGQIRRQHSRAGDHVELLALMDVLAVPNVCGADIMRTSNFALKPVKLQVFRASERDLARVPPLRSYASQKTPAQFRQKEIKATRALARDPGYTPQFTNVPLQQSDWPVPLDANDYALLQSAGLGELYQGNDGDALRDVIFSWWERHFIAG